MQVSTKALPGDSHAVNAVYRYLDLYGTGAGDSNAIYKTGADIGNATFDYTGGAAEDIWTLAAHGLKTGQPVYFDAVGTGATGFAVDTTYYVVEGPNANTFKLATSLANAIAGTVIEGSDDSVGTWSLTVGTYESDDIETTPIFFTATQTTVIERMLLGIEDGAGVKPELYGAAAALTNGILVQVQDSSGNVIVDLTDGEGVKSNAGWGWLCFDVREQAYANTPTNETILVRWTFSRAGRPIILNPGEKFVVLLRDNFSALVNHKFMIQGYKA